MILSTENKSLKPYNTFGLDVKAKLFVEIHTREELNELLASGMLKKEKFFVLGGGSNVIFVNDFDGIVVKISTKGITVEYEDEHEVILKVEAGENWEQFVDYCVDKNWSGLENLSAIPGTVGASAVQNMGAYGTETKDSIVKVETIEISTAKPYVFEGKDCEFDYRASIFKTTYSNRFIITSVFFRLSKKPLLNISYNALKQELEHTGITQPTIKDIAETVKRIRKEKLPSPDEAGSIGSFFKNPIVSEEYFNTICQKYPNTVHYPAKNGIKLAAAYLIDQCGWKGKNVGGASVHTKQALVLVNTGNASGSDVLRLAMDIQQSIFDTFGVELEFEAIIV